MNSLELALMELLQDVVQDHWLVALVLSGHDDVELPTDPELAELVRTVRTTGVRDLCALAEQHPEAVRRQLEWASESDTDQVIELDGPAGLPTIAA